MSARLTKACATCAHGKAEHTFGKRCRMQSCPCARFDDGERFTVRRRERANGRWSIVEQSVQLDQAQRALVQQSDALVCQYVRDSDGAVIAECGRAVRAALCFG